MAFVEDGFDRAALETAVAQWVLLGSDLPVGKVYWAEQADAARPAEPAIAIRLTSENDSSMPWVDHVTNYLAFPDLLIASRSGSTVTVPTHALNTGTGPVQIVTTGTPPAPLVAGTNYWVIVPSATTLQFATTFQNAMAGVFITLSSSGTGNNTIVHQPTTLLQGSEMVFVARSEDRLILTLECYATNGVSQASAMNFLRKIISRSQLPSMMAILRAANLGLTQFDRVRFVKGMRDAVILEPRAYLEVRLCSSSEASETSNIIETAQMHNLLTGVETDVDGGQ